MPDDGWRGKRRLSRVPNDSPGCSQVDVVRGKRVETRGFEPEMAHQAKWSYSGHTYPLRVGYRKYPGHPGRPATLVRGTLRQLAPPECKRGKKVYASK